MNHDAATFRLLYRHLLHISNRLPNATKKTEAVQNIKNKFREHINSKCAEKESEENVKELFKVASSRLGYLKMMTPRTAHRGYTGGDSSRTFYYKGDKIDSGADFKNMGTTVSVLMFSSL